MQTDIHRQPQQGIRNIIMEKIKELDPSQKASVTTSVNAVISAGAGSGKTSVLAQRFTYLVTQKKLKVDEILTLTFTKKATVEMYGRIYKALKEKDPSSVDEFYKAKIQTLDSYCASVVRMGAHLYGIKPDFSENDDTIINEVSASALPFILKNRDNKAIRMLVETKDYAAIANELFVKPALYYSSIAHPIDYKAELDMQVQEVTDAWNNNVKQLPSMYDELKALFGDCPANKNTKFAVSLSACLANEFPEPPVITAEDVTSGNVEPLEQFCTSISSFSSIKQTGANGEAWSPIKDILNQFRSAYGTLVPLANYVYGYTTTEAIIPLIEKFQSQANDIKRNLGILTFKDTADLAVLMLREHPELRAIEKNKYKAILIDEFQDNNSTQRDMLFLLAERQDRMEKTIPAVSELCPDKLFFVGDEKQSIYRFRGADVSVFRSLKNSFPQGNIELETNYRSHPALIASFNTFFGGIPYPTAEKTEDENPAVFFREKGNAGNEPIPNYEAVYRNVLVPKEKAEAFKKVIAEEGIKKAYDPRVHFAFVAKDLSKENEDGEKLLNEEETEALWVARKIKSLIEGDEEHKPVKPGDIALLFRSYSKQPTFERMLLQAGVPYNCEVIKGFFSDGPVNDLLSFLRLCIYPSDTMAYAVLLRSPFVNLNQQEIAAVLAVSDSELFSDEQKKELGEKASERFSHAADFFRKISTDAKTDSIAHTVSRLWYEFGYRYETLWNRKVEMYTTLYDRIFELARQADENSTGLASFVDGMRTYEDQDEKLDGMDIPLEHGDSVHLLTIFKSKGLEYPVVFICGADGRTQNDTNSEAVYFSSEYGVTINTPPVPSLSDKKSNYFYEKIKAQESSMKCAELRRIVYVAMTRAIDELYITGKSNFDFSKGMQYVPGGMNPGTIYTTLLPILHRYTDEDGNTANGPFSLEKIETVTRKEAYDSSEARTRANDPSAKISFIAETERLYGSTPVMQKDTVLSPYRSPSQLHEPDDETTKFAAPVTDAPFKEINEIVESTRPIKIAASAAGNDTALPDPKFLYSNFGTIAHAHLEAQIKGTKPDISEREWLGLDGNNKKKEKVLEICEKMAYTFKESNLGKEAVSSSWHKAEYSFRSSVASYIIKGTIDLVFKNKDGSFTIVDYKTNQTIEPALYYSQLACYREAVSSMLGCDAKKIRCCLYYLRFGKAVDITGECAAVDISEAVKQADKGE